LDADKSAYINNIKKVTRKKWHFKEMIGMPSSEKERKVLEEAKHYLSNPLS
jgi:hypothetical protein